MRLRRVSAMEGRVLYPIFTLRQGSTPKRNSSALKKPRREPETLTAATAATSTVEAKYREVFVDELYGRSSAQHVMNAYRAAHAQDLASRERNHKSTATATFEEGCSRSPIETPCWRFFKGQTRANASAETIDDLLALGRGDAWQPDTLEYRHDYIQWLFPLRETGVNWAAPLLTSPDAACMRADAEVMTRVLLAFQMMLRFYGMEATFFTSTSYQKKSSSSSTTTTTVVSGETESASGASAVAAAGMKRSPRSRGRCPAGSHVELHVRIARTPDDAERVARYDNLQWHNHNYLRISRVLQFLGEMDMEELKVGWLRFLMHEVLLGNPSTDSSMMDAESSSGESEAWNAYMAAHRRKRRAMNVKGSAPLCNCKESLLTFWIETPYDAKVRATLKKETLDMVSLAGEARSEASSPSITVTGVMVPTGVDIGQLSKRLAHRKKKEAH